MPDALIVSEAELREAVQLDLNIIDCVEDAFRKLASGGVVMPPILSLPVEEHNGEVDVKTAYVPGLPSFAIKMSPGFFNNPALGLPSTGGLMVLLAAKTGTLEAILLDNGYLTDIRTAAAGGVAARCLSRPESSSATILGAGRQAALQLQALCLVRPITRAVLWARDADKARTTALSLGEPLGIDVSLAPSIEEAVSEADIVVTTTPSHTPLVEAGWLKNGVHVTAMGSDQPHKRELTSGCLTRCDLYVPDRQAQTAVLGELNHAIKDGTVSDGERFPELGDILLDPSKGRTDAGQITVCDLTGTGIQDTAIASLAYRRAVDAAKGQIFKN